MNANSRSFVAGVFLWALMLLLHGASAVCQEATSSDSDKAAREKTFRERTIYIPYEKLRKVFEARGRGVFLPYEEFQELWKAAREKAPQPDDQQPPVDAVISEVASEGTVSGDVMQIKARLTIELLRKGWHKVPLRLADAAITRATIDGKPARLLQDPQQGYQLLVERGEEASPPLAMEIEFAKAISRAPGRNQVSIDVPQAPVSRWRITIPEPGVKVDIQPLLAASEAPEAEKAADKTVVLAFVGATPTVSIGWTPKTEGATGLAALATVQTQQQVWINEGVTRTRCQLTYTISRAKVPSLAIAVPADQKVVNVFDANVRQWSVAAKDGRQQIDVQLFEPAEGTQSLTIELEQFSDQAKGNTLGVPAVEALGVGRQQGLVLLRVSPALRAETSERTGLLQVDAAELPGPLAQEKWDFAYRYAAVPFTLKLAVEKVEPRVMVDSLAQIDLWPDRIELSLSAVYDVQRAGIYRLEWDVPEGYEVREVRGIAMAQVTPARVDTYHLTGEEKTRLVVNLASKALGRTGLLVRLQKSLHCPELLAPPEEPAEIAVVVPRVAGEWIEEDRGRIVFRSPRSLRINPIGQKGLRAVSFPEAYKGMEGAAQPGNPELEPTFAFAFGHDLVELNLAAQRRKPHVTVGQLLSMRIEEDTLRYEAVFTYDALYSGVKSLRIDVPESLAARLHNQTPTVREQAIEPAPADVPKGYQAWSFTGQTELLGRGKIVLVWEEKIEKLDLGKGVPLAIPCLIPSKADDAPIDRAWGQIVLVKAETIDLQPSGTPEGLRPIDPEHDLMDGARVAGAGQAFEFHGPWSLTVTATRYELQDVKRTSIENAVVRMVVTRADAVAVQAIYRLRSARQRLEVALPAGVDFDTEPLRINGRPVMLEQGGKDRYFIPLTQSSADRPLLVDLRYTLPKWNRGVLSLAEFPENPAIQKVYLCVYLPDERALLGIRGPWTNEIRWRRDHTMNWWKPTHPASDAWLVEELKQNITVASDPLEGFQTDGRRYVFSTLRPTGGLRLIEVDQTWLTVAMLAVLVIGGLVLATASIRIRALATGGLVAAIVLCGMFAPLFARQILDGYFVAALAVVAVVWVVAFAMRQQRRGKTASSPQVAASPPCVATPSGPPEITSPAQNEPETRTDDSASPFGDEGGKTHA